MALFLSYSNIVPVHRLLGIFREHPNLAASGGKNEYDFLQGNISRLISHNKTMKEEMRRQLPLLRDAFLKRLVKGEFDSLSEAEAAMMQAGVTFPGTFGYVGMIKIIGYNGYVTQDILNELNAARLLAIQALRNNFPNSMQMTALDSDKMTFIWTDRQQPEGGAMRHLEEQLNGLKAFLESEYRISVIVSIGSPFQGLHGVAKSFNEAKHALELALFTENQWLLWYEQMTKETSGYSYPIDLEIRLMNAAKLGHFNEVQSILAEIVEKNFHERQLSAESAQQLISALKGTLYRLLEQQLFRIAQEREHFHAQLEQISGLDGLEQVHSRIETLFEQYCRLVLQRKSESHHEIIRKINEFLQAHYSDPNLSLYRLAELTGYPEKYISALYKEQTGENLSDYLEKIRIRHAMELLFRTDRTIDEIAARVGYNSAHSFRRAFKRVAGESPSIYRKSVQ
jgi:AraC-like DNA-binding protein